MLRRGFRESTEKGGIEVVWGGAGGGVVDGGGDVRQELRCKCAAFVGTIGDATRTRCRVGGELDGEGGGVRGDWLGSGGERCEVMGPVVGHRGVDG